MEDSHLSKNLFTAVLLVASLLPFTAFADRFDGRPGHGRPGYGPRPGETVWTDAGLEGQVEAIFPDGRLSVKIGYASYQYQRAQLAVRGCSRGLCSGSEVITTNGLKGSINGIYPSGVYSVRIGYANYQYRFEDLANSNPYNPGYGLQMGQVVWTEAGLEGRVAALFPNGDVSVTIGYAQYKYSSQVLGYEGCVYNLCSGNNVITNNGLKGTVNGVYPSGKLSVKIGYANYQFDFSQLARTR